LISNRV